MKDKKRIFFVHLLNDYSGSPLVLSQVVKKMAASGHDCHVFTHSDEQGYLSGIEGVNYHTFFYKWSKHKWATFLLLMFSQAILFFQIVARHKRGTVIYVNTVLPFGAALAGKCVGAKVVYHLHETSIKPALLKRFLFFIANATASDAIYVSWFLYEQERLSRANNHLVSNAISDDFLQTSQQYKAGEKSQGFQVLMLCSLKLYKGVLDFVQLAQQLPEIKFCLVLNATPQDIDAFFSEKEKPHNLAIHSAQKNVHPFYAQSHLLLNLSHPDTWKETFGMTVIEGMAYGLPAIVPPVGGIAELVKEGINGFQISHREQDNLVTAIKRFATDQGLYRMFSLNALKKLQDFSEERFARNISHVF